MSVIKVMGLTKDYGAGRGVFGLDFEVNEGEIYGYMGTNGSGKTTTIRNLMGFIRPDLGSASVLGYDSTTENYKFNRRVGYVPGEIAFPDIGTGIDFIKIQAEMLRVKDLTMVNSVIERLHLDPSANLRRMSKGMKQKTAIAAALIADPELLILDEPSTGLDPLMRLELIDLLLNEKKRGKTIFISSHVFEEMEDTCDRVALIKDGRILTVAEMSMIRHHNVKTYKLEFTDKADYKNFLALPFEVTAKKEQYGQVTVNIRDEDVNGLFKALAGMNVKYISEIKFNLEQYFTGVYQKESRI